MKRWRNTANNGEQGAVVRDRFLPTDADGWLSRDVEPTPEEEAKMRLLPSWTLGNDGQTRPAGPEATAEPAAPTPDDATEPTAEPAETPNPDESSDGPEPADEPDTTETKGKRGKGRKKKG